MRHESLQTAIRARAHELWEREGRPDGRALAHWLRAERELTADADGALGGLRAPMLRPEFEPTASASPRER